MLVSESDRKWIIILSKWVPFVARLKVHKWAAHGTFKDAGSAVQSTSITSKVNTKLNHILVTERWKSNFITTHICKMKIATPQINKNIV